MTKAGKGILRGAQDALDYVRSRTDDIKVDTPNVNTLEAMRELESNECVRIKNKDDFFKDSGL